VKTANKKKYLREIKDIIDFWAIEGLRESLERWYRAGMSHNYSWTHGSPGNLLFLHDQVIAFVEVGHALMRISYTSTSTKKKITPLKKFMELAEQQTELSSLPIHLDLEEITDPYHTLQLLFKTHNLKEIKETNVSASGYGST
jgi:hypothetical protein